MSGANLTLKCSGVGVGLELWMTAERRAPHVSGNESLGARWTRVKRSSRPGHRLGRARAPEDFALPESLAGGDTWNRSRPCSDSGPR